MPIANVKQSLRFLLATSILASANAAYAQSIVPARDGLNTSVNKIGNQYNISGGTQAGANLFYSLQKLGLSTGEIANFFSSPRVQNILTRVTGGEASLINGLIQVTGGNSNLYILNPAGIVFGATASLNVPANFSATTATGIQVGNGWFGLNSSVDEIRSLNGNINGFAFTSTLPSLGTSPSGVILNQGDLRTNVGQSVTLVGGIVVNTGTIATPSGNITIAATPDNKFIKITNEGNVLSLELPISARQALGNAPVLRGVDLPSLLTGKTVGTAFVAGNLDVAGANGGNVQVLGTNVNLSGANINASGFNGGGTVLIGGDYQGTGTTPKSLFTSIDANTKIHADALLNGNGGKVIVWSDGTTAFDGTITAKAGSLSGNGGLVETSGKSNLVVGNSAKVNTSALNGTKGTWLLDPTSITVVASDGTDASVAAANLNAGDSTINSSTVVSALNGTNVNLVATNVITVNAAIDASSNANAGNLTLTAPTTNLNAPITLKGASTLSGTAKTVNVGASGTVQNGVDASAARGTVNLAATTYTLTATVAINKNLTVNGAGAANTTVSGNNAVQVVSIGGFNFNRTVNINGLTVAKGKSTNGGGVLVNQGATLNLANSTFSNNSAGFGGGGAISNLGTINITNSTFSNNSASFGGAISNRGTINITNSTFSNNSASFGGAISNKATTNITNSTFSNNSSRSNGGAIENISDKTINITNSTFSNNSSGDKGGAIFKSNIGTINITNSILVGNNAKTSGSEEVSGNITSNGYNLVGVNGNAGGFQTIATDRVLAGEVSTAITALGDYGGATQTFALVPNSPAIDAGNNASTPATDQRGLARIVNGTIDIGSFESRGFTFTTTGTPQSTTVNRAFSTPLAVTVSSIDNTPVNGGTITFTAPSSAATAAFSGLLTTTVAIINGVATAPTLTANTKAGNYTVTATATGAATPANFTLTNNPDVAASITATSGTSQSTRVNTNFANQLQVLVRDQFGNLVPNSIVTFTSPSTGASTATTTTATTDANGVAQVSVRANTISGSFVTTGTSGAATPANFTLTNNPDVAASITATSGTSQSTRVNTNFANQLQVLVRDQFGNLVPNSIVTFTSPSTGASTATTTTSATTDANGVAQVSVRANTISGTFVTTGTSGEATPANFTLTNNPDVAASITATSGTSQSTRVNTNFANQLQVLVRDQFGNLVPNSIVTFTSPSTGASTATTTTATTDANGVAQVSVRANTISGSFVTTGTSGAATPANFTLTNNPDVAASITATSGTSQSTRVNTNFANQLQVLVRDQFGNLVPNSIVTFTSPSTGASTATTTTSATTDANGVAQVSVRANTISGTFVTTGTSGEATPANFTLTNNPDVAASITATSGTSQSTRVNTNFANQLQVLVRDQFGNLVPNSIVTFTSPSTGASTATTTTSATTDANGVAQVSVRANTISGTFVTTGTSGEATPANFTLTNNPDVAASITATSGTSQSTRVNTNFANQLQVLVRDQFGNLVPNSIVTFTSPSTGASTATTTTATTDANGVAQVSVRANTISGSFVTTGTSGAATPANFTLTNNPDVAASITATSGTSQSTRVNTNFANQLQVLVRDQFGNLVPNSIVTFTSPSTGASTATTTTSATTDANGVAQVSVRANTISGTFVTTGTSGEATPANFTLTNNPDVPASNTSFTLTNNPDVPVSTTATSGTALSNVVNQAFKGANNSVGSQATKTLKDGAESVDSQATKTLKDEAEEEKNLQFE